MAIGGLPPVEVSARVWRAVLRDRGRGASKGPDDWSEAEKAGYGLYAPLLGPAGNAFVMAQAGQSLDGRVATPAGDCRDISGAGGLSHLHRLRALCDAVIVGSKTVLCDDPRLTVRLVGGPDPARVAIDPNGRIPEDSQIWRGDGRRIVVQCRETARPGGVEVIRAARGADGSIDPAALLAALSERGFRRVLVEGGARTIGAFLEAGLVDRMHVAVAPKIIGSGPAAFALPPIRSLSQALRPRISVYGLGTDVLFDCAFAAAG